MAGGGNGQSVRRAAWSAAAWRVTRRRQALIAPPLPLPPPPPPPPQCLVLPATLGCCWPAVPLYSASLLLKPPCQQESQASSLPWPRVTHSWLSSSPVLLVLLRPPLLLPSPLLVLLLLLLLPPLSLLPSTTSLPNTRLLLPPSTPPCPWFSSPRPAPACQPSGHISQPAARKRSHLIFSLRILPVSPAPPACLL